jgi:hypothetical protein
MTILDSTAFGKSNSWPAPSTLALTQSRLSTFGSVKHGLTDLIPYSNPYSASREKECCMPRTTTPMLGPEGLELERLVVERNRVILFGGDTGTWDKVSRVRRQCYRVHRRYIRTVADLPWHAIPVTLRIHVRRFFWEDPSCGRVIIAERLSEVAAYACKTEHLQEELVLIGFALGKIGSEAHPSRGS